jgi:hypothetical protein
MPMQSGTVAMSRDDPEWQLHQGVGVRTADTTVVFVPAFVEVPKVVVSISGSTLVGVGTSPINLTVRAKNIRRESFEVEFGTSGDCRIFGVDASWVAHTD